MSAHREVLAATAIFVAVLAVIDAAAFQNASVVLSLLPFLFMVVAALVPLTLRWVAAWIGAVVVPAVISGHARYAGLAYPAILVGVLLMAQRRRRAGA